VPPIPAPGAAIAAPPDADDAPRDASAPPGDATGAPRDAIVAIDAPKRADAGVDAATSDKKTVPFMAIL
jgi:hypothetical protein